MTDKEQLELISLCKCVESQREEIKRLTAQLERQKEYTRMIEELLKRSTNRIEQIKSYFQAVTHTA